MPDVNDPRWQPSGPAPQPPVHQPPHGPMPPMSPGAPPAGHRIPQGIPPYAHGPQASPGWAQQTPPAGPGGPVAPPPYPGAGAHVPGPPGFGGYAPAPPPPRRRGTAWLVVGIVGLAVALIAGVVVVVMFMNSGKGGTEPVVQPAPTVTHTYEPPPQPQTEPTFEASDSAPIPSPTPTSTPSEEPTQQPIRVRVEYTCGKDGNGDCFVAERTQPSGSGALIRRWDNGQSLEIVCQVRGASVRSSALNASSDVWSRTTTGGYVATIYLGGVDKYTVTTPCR